MTVGSSFSPRKSRHVFKGFPLADFLHPSALDTDSVLAKPLLEKALRAHIAVLGRDLDSSERESTAGGTRTRAPAFSGAARTTTARAASSTGPLLGGIRPNSFNVNAGDKFVDPSDIPPSFQEMLEDFLDGLYLGRFKSSVIQPEPRRPPLRYIFEIGFNTDKTTGFIVKSPLDTLITFGPRDPRQPYTESDVAIARLPGPPTFNLAPAAAPRNALLANPRPSRVGSNRIFGGSGKVLRTPDARPSAVCDLNFRIIVDDENRLQLLSVFGDTLKVHLSKGLVQPVERSGGKWTKTGQRLGFDVGERIITFQKNRLPTWGGVIELGDIPVSISSSDVIGKLNKVNLGGTPEKPLIVFDDVEIVEKS